MSKTVLIRMQPLQGRASVGYIDDKPAEANTGSTGVGLGMDERVRGRIKEELEKGHRRFVVDLTGVRWLSSSSLGVVLAWRQIVVGKGGEFVLANPSKRVKTLVEHLKLEAIVKVFDSLSDAQQHFSDTAQ
jgi:anti-sigma B factor antagonist